MDAVINRAFRGARRGVGGPPVHDQSPFRRIDDAFRRSRLLVKLYYLASVYVCYTLLSQLDRLAEVAGAWQFQWPIAWLDAVEPQTGIRWVTTGCFLVALAAFRFPNSRTIRALFAVLFLCVAAVPNSLGAVNHGYHAWFWIGALLVLLPNTGRTDASRATRMAYLSVISAIQALLMLFYSLSGLWKVTAGVDKLIAGVPGNFSPTGFARTLANRIVETGTSPPLAEFVIDNVWLAWPMFLALVYVQLVAVLVAFRPRLHALWGYLLVLFHLGTWLLMQISFPLHVMFLLLFFAMSPFRPAQTRPGELVTDLPILGILVRPWKNRSAHQRIAQ